MAIGSRRGRVVARMLLAALSVGFSLLLAEGMLRGWFWMRGVGRDDAIELLRRSAVSTPPQAVDARGVAGLVVPSVWPDVIYEVRPNLRGRFRGQAIATNSHGMRSAEIERSKPAGVYRVLGLGDSFMFGWGVAQGETYLELLEARLNAGGERRYETANFAAPGYNTAMQASLYEHRGRYFDPDLVILHYVSNDHLLPHFLQGRRSLAPRSWFLVELARAALGRTAPEEEIELIPGNPFTLEEVAPEERAQYRGMIGRVGYRRAMERLVRLTREDGVPLIVLVQGTLRDDRRMMLAVAEDLGLEVIDALPYFGALLEREGLPADRAAFRRAFVIPRDGHPTPLGHRAYADALQAELRRLGYVGGESG